MQRLWMTEDRSRWLVYSTASLRLSRGKFGFWLGRVFPKFSLCESAGMFTSMEAIVTWCWDSLQDDTRIDIQWKNMRTCEQQNHVQVGMKYDFVNVRTVVDGKVAVFFEEILFIHFPRLHKKFQMQKTSDAILWLATHYTTNFHLLSLADDPVITFQLFVLSLRSLLHRLFKNFKKFCYFWEILLLAFPS